MAAEWQGDLSLPSLHVVLLPSKNLLCVGLHGPHTTRLWLSTCHSSVHISTFRYWPELTVLCLLAPTWASLPWASGWAQSPVPPPCLLASLHPWSCLQRLKDTQELLSFPQAMSPDGEAIVTGAGDETLRFWNVFSKTRSTKVRWASITVPLRAQACLASLATLP